MSVGIATQPPYMVPPQSGWSPGGNNVNPLPQDQQQNANGPTDSRQIIQQYLDQYGLGTPDMITLVNGWVSSGATQAQIDAELPQTQAYKTRFPAIAARQAAGMPPLNPTEYLAYEKQASQLEQEAGLPQGTINTNDLLTKDVSVAELGRRIQQGYEAAMAAPAETRQQLQTLYGIGPGDLTHFFLDPATAEPLLMQKFQAAQVAGSAQTAGYGQLGVSTAEGLAAQGVTASQAQSGFTHLGNEAQLFTGLPGSSEQQIGQDVQLGAEFGGNAQDQQAIQRRASQRVAAFQGGGDFAGGSKGLSGIGGANNS